MLGPEPFSAWFTRYGARAAMAVMATPRLLSEWVHKRQVLTFEQAIRKLMFESASAFSIHRPSSTAKCAGGRQARGCAAGPGDPEFVVPRALELSGQIFAVA